MKTTEQRTEELKALGLSINYAAIRGYEIPLSGNTFDRKDLLKQFGARWDGMKKSWVFKGNEELDNFLAAAK